MKLSLTIEQLFKDEIDVKYQIFNALFHNLPFNSIKRIGELIPLLANHCKDGLDQSLTPTEIMETFFSKYAYLTDEKSQLDFLFAIIQYIERQVVLFDSVEEAAFSTIHQHLTEGTIKSVYQFAKQNNYKNSLYQKVKQNKIRIVYTAHPTQFYPNEVLRIISDLQQAIGQNNYPEIAMLLQQLGKTPFINKQKPTPLEEARSIIYYLRYVNYEAIQQLHTKVYDLFYENGDDFKPLVELGFWPGGDRDGNPFVTADITRKVVEELRYNILTCYYQDAKKLVSRLTFQDVKPLILELKDRIYENLHLQKNDITASYLIEQLQKIKYCLRDQYENFFVDKVDNFIRQVKTFGTYFASIDIRQDSSKHHELLDSVCLQYLKKSYSSLSEKEKEDFLFHSSILIHEDDYRDPVCRDTIINIKQLKEIQQAHGERSIHRYIISNSTSHWHVLEVLALFRFCGYMWEEIKFDIIPLFETIEGLASASTIMSKLYTSELYLRHLALRLNKQMIMLGFSDGTKDGGYVKANWEIFTNKEKLTTLARKHDIDVLFFDGRGGPPGRGGGKTHQFYAAQGETIASKEIQLTIQGQTISSQYGSVTQALYNMEQLLTACLLAGFNVKKNASISKGGRFLLDEIADISHLKYLELKNHPLFVDYLERFSVLPLYANTNIGSRPSKRSKDESKLSLNDLRAIPFVGSWGQIKQNVPGYFGFGTGIEAFIQQGKLKEIQHLYKSSLYFKTLVQNSMMSLSKTNFLLTAYIQKDSVFSSLWEMLHKEYLLTVKNLLLVTQENELMQREILNKLSIQKREDIVLPLVLLQQYALLKSQSENNYKIVYQKIATRAIFGSINASRNSA